MSNVQLTGSKEFDSQIIMHSCTQKIDVSIAKHSPKNCLGSKVNMESFIRENKREISSKRKWTDREYNIQDNADVAHKDVKIYCDTNRRTSKRFKKQIIINSCTHKKDVSLDK